MCGGNKGQSQTAQTQTYQPNPAAASAITGAIGTAQQAASAPFQQPVAPVAGFSPDQLAAFGTVNSAQGMANPYFTQASQLFNQSTQAPNVNQFFNPMADAVTAQMKNIFGQQNSQNTGQLTQAAGGVGSDRIAVGQGELANQQGLAAGQTLANLYQPAYAAAAQQQGILQSAGYGMGALGPAAQNSVLQGANAQLGTGGLQQQLQQAQLNAPYQNILAQLAYPFQTSNFLSGTIGALAPGLGGTTSGMGTSTPAQPSIISQILGAGTAAAGLAGGMGAFSGPSTADSYGGGSAAAGDAYGGSAAAPLPGLTAADYGGSPFSNLFSGQRGGAVNPYARGGDVGYDGGGNVIDPMVPDTPMLSSGSPSIVPDTKLTPIQPHIPQLNLNPPAASSSSSTGDALKMGMDVAKMAMMFAQRGGRIDPKKFDGANPYAFARGGYADAGVVDDPTADEGPFRMPDAAAIDAWRSGVDRDRSLGLTSPPSADTPPLPPGAAAAFAGPDSTGAALPPEIATGASANAYAPSGGQGVRGSSRFAADPVDPNLGKKDPGFAGSPWAALMQAGLGMMGGTSPFAGVNIGQGGQQGLKVLEQQREAAQKDTTIDQAAQRLAQESKFHEDQYNRLTAKERLDLTKPVSGGTVYDPVSGQMRHIMYARDPKTGEWKPLQGEPVMDTEGKPVKGIATNIGDGILEGRQPPTFTGLGRVTPQVRSYLEDKKFDLAKAQLEYKSAEKQIQALNGPQMQRGYQLSKSVDSTIDEVKELSQQMQLGGIPFMNKLELQKFIQTQGNTEKGQLATKYMTAVNTLKEEFANLANGGYAPTEPAWALANEQVNGNFGAKQLDASLTEIKRLINYRMGFMSQGFGPGAGNRYKPAETNAPATTAPAQTAPAQTKPPTITQNGFTYTLQPDGSYK